jgi:hypothetical protein
LLQHVRREDDDASKIIGIYATEEAASQAIERLKMKPGFLDAPDGFHIDRYTLNRDHWIEGFVDL